MIIFFYKKINTQKDYILKDKTETETYVKFPVYEFFEKYLKNYDLIYDGGTLNILRHG